MFHQYGKVTFDDVTGDVFEDEHVNDEDRLDDEYYYADAYENYDFDQQKPNPKFDDDDLVEFGKKENRADS